MKPREDGSATTSTWECLELGNISRALSPSLFFFSECGLHSYTADWLTISTF